MPETINYKKVSEVELIKAVIRKDPGAEVHFLKEVVAKIVDNLIYHRFGHLKLLAGDICNDFYIQYSQEGWKVLNSVKHLKTYLRSVLYRFILNKYCGTAAYRLKKKTEPLTEFTLSVADDSMSIMNKLDLELLNAKVMKLLSELKNSDDKDVMYGVLNGLTNSEIAAKLQINSNVVSIRKNRVRNIINEKINRTNYGI